MKGRNLFLLGIATILLGVLLVIFRTSLANGKVVLIAGTLFVIAGVLNMTVFLGSRDKEGKARMGAFGTTFGWIASAAAVVLGLAMLIFNGAFVAITGFMFGVLIIFAALFQLCLLIFGSKPTRLTGWFYLVPAALIAASIFIFTKNPEAGNEHLVMLITGISFIVFGFFTIIEGTAIGQVNRQTRKQLEDEAAAALRPDKNASPEEAPRTPAESAPAAEPEAEAKPGSDSEKQ